MKKLLLIGFLSAAAFTGCKKKAADAGDGSGSDMGSSMAGSSMAGSSMAGSGSGSATTPPAGSDTMAGSGSAAMAGSGSGSAAAPAAGAIADTAAYTAKADALSAKMMDTTKETDCDKLGDAMDKFATDNKADIDAVDAYEKAHDADKKAWEDKHKADMDKMMAPIEKCKDNAKVKAAMAKMPM